MESQPKAETRNSKPKTQKREQKKRQKKPRKITQSYLRNAGLFYLQRFPASSGHFKTVMLRKVKKSCAYHKDQDYETCTEMLDTLIKDLLKEGFLDDSGYVRGMVTSLRRQGKSRKAIFAKLQQKSVPHEDIEKALTSYDHEYFDDASDAEFISALKFARKKKLGIFDTAEKYDYTKSLSMLARQGFQYDTAQKIMQISTETLEELPTEARAMIDQALSSLV